VDGTGRSQPAEVRIADPPCPFFPLLHIPWNNFLAGRFGGGRDFQLLTLGKKIGHIFVAAAFGLMIVLMAGPSAAAVPAVHCVTTNYQQHSTGDQHHQSTSCCTDMHCCPLIPALPAAKAPSPGTDAVGSWIAAAVPLLLIRAIDPPPKTAEF